MPTVFPSFYDPYPCPEQKDLPKPIAVGFGEILIEAEIQVVRDFGSRKVKAWGFGKNGRALSALFHPVDDILKAEIIVFSESMPRAENHFERLFPGIKQVVFFDWRKGQPRYQNGVIYPWEKEHEMEAEFI